MSRLPNSPNDRTQKPNGRRCACGLTTLPITYYRNRVPSRLTRTLRGVMTAQMAEDGAQRRAVRRPIRVRFAPYGSKLGERDLAPSSATWAVWSHPGRSGIVDSTLSVAAQPVSCAASAHTGSVNRQIAQDQFGRYDPAQSGDLPGWCGRRLLSKQILRLLRMRRPPSQCAQRRSERPRWPKMVPYGARRAAADSCHAQPRSERRFAHAQTLPRVRYECI